MTNFTMRTLAATLFGVLAMAVLPARAADDQTVPVSMKPAQPERGAVLPALYGSLIGLEVYDAYSTQSALVRGGTEVNPLMTTVAGNPTLLWATKSVAAFTSIYASEKLWRQHHRAQAIAVMVATNGIMLAVASHNAAVLHGGR